MNRIQSLDGIFGIDDTRDIDLGCPLTDHFNVDISLRKSTEHARRYSDHFAHLFSDQRQDRHAGLYSNLSNDPLSHRERQEATKQNRLQSRSF